MVKEKGLPVEVADQIGEYVKLSGGKELINRLEQDGRLSTQPLFQSGLGDMKLLFQYCDVMNITNKVREESC